MPNMTKDNLQSEQNAFDEFLVEYVALCKKYNLIVDACSCCQSPWVIVPPNEDEIDGHIEHLQREWSDMVSREIARASTP